MVESIDIENNQPSNVCVFAGDVFSSLDNNENQVSMLMEIEEIEHSSDIDEQYQTSAFCISLILINIAYGPFIGCNFVFTLETTNRCIISHPPFGILTIHYYLFGCCIIEICNYFLLSFLVVAFSKRELERMSKIDWISKSSYGNLIFCIIWYSIGFSMLDNIQMDTCDKGIQNYLILYTGYKSILCMYLLLRVLCKCNNDCQ